MDITWYIMAFRETETDVVQSSNFRMAFLLWESHLELASSELVLQSWILVTLHGRQRTRSWLAQNPKDNGLKVLFDVITIYCILGTHAKSIGLGYIAK